MKRKNSGPTAGLILGVTLTIALFGCSKPDGHRILGHWRAERMQFQGVSLPMGPEFVVSSSELRSTDGSINIPLTGIKAKDDTTTLVLGGPIDIGLSFKFETEDRISFEIPLVNSKVYYQRVFDSPPSETPATVGKQVQAPSIRPTDAGVAPNRAPQPVQQRNANETRPSEGVRSQADVQGSTAKASANPDPMADYNLSILHMRRGDPDAAVRSLRDAFEHGFRDFGSLDRSPDIAPLKSDPRYIALVTRYR